ncbi:P-loop containing nucleoside triphosphate hydrolase protein [Xylariaceae sp. FL1651]|nr:P-loop containing nucleoside triphosphate hydrolase protein [Xylariaceae sp. FL1651]
MALLAMEAHNHGKDALFVHGTGDSQHDDLSPLDYTVQQIVCDVVDTVALHYEEQQMPQPSAYINSIRKDTYEPILPYDDTRLKSYVGVSAVPAKVDSATSTKRKNDQSDLPNEAKLKKKPRVTFLGSSIQKLESKKKTQDKVASIAGMEFSTSTNSEYTPQQQKLDEGALSEAIKVFKSKISIVGQEASCPNSLYLIEGMQTPLRDYQVVGAAYMVRLETARNPPHGGIIADAMGIGKTVQAAACMHFHPPSKKATRQGAGVTLIVVPNQGLIDQWMAELCKHIGGDINRKIEKYSGGKKTSSIYSLQHVPYILATYSTIERDFRRHNSKKNEVSLFEINFYRILLDEGDSIKSIGGSTSKACAELKGKHKWVLSGTPLRNYLKEALSYFRFIGIAMDEARDVFEAAWGSLAEDNKNARTLQVISQRMLRRLVRRALKERAEIAKANAEMGLIDADTTRPNYNGLCTNLRQAVDHPFHLDSCLREILTIGEVQNLADKLSEVKPQVPVYEQIKTEWEGPWSLECLNTKQQPPSFCKSVLDISQLLSDVQLSKDNTLCLECYTTEDVRILKCGHVMCVGCLNRHIQAESNKGRGNCKCPRCGIYLFDIKQTHNYHNTTRLSMERGPTNIQNSIKILNNEDLEIASSHGVSVVLYSGDRKHSPGNDVNGMQPHLKTSDSGNRWLWECDKNDQIVPSTKMIVATCLIQAWLVEAPEDQIVVFMEWNMSAKILGRMLDQLEVQYVYYWGDMTSKARNKSLENFKSDPKIKVMITSVGAGNVGLNITCANRVISMNPWWNLAAEMQAFGRVKRHGQTKETHLVRLIAKDTMDEKLVELQVKKTAEISEALMHGKKSRTLSSGQCYSLLVGDSNEEFDSDMSDEEDPMLPSSGDDGDEDYTP